MTQFKHIAIIFNPNSTGDAEKNAETLKSELQSSMTGLAISMLPTARAGHAVELAYEFAREHKNALIVSASGDGGYNEVINGAMKAQEEGAQPICAVLASGNANDHARTIQSAPLLELIQQNKPKYIDLLKVTATDANGTETSRYAHAYIGIGLTPTIAVELNKHTLNSLKEAWIVTKTFWSYRPVIIKIDGKKRKLDSLICSTIPEMAKVLTFSEKSKPEDGLFEVTTFKHHRKVMLALRLIKGIFKHLGAQKRTRTFSFTLLMPAPMQVDGEVMELGGDTEVAVEVYPGLLRTLA